MNFLQLKNCYYGDMMKIKLKFEKKALAGLLFSFLKQSFAVVLV